MTVHAGPHLPSRRTTRLLVAAGTLSALAWTAAQILAPPDAVDWTDEMGDAAARMDWALAVVRRHRETAGPPLDPALDPNRTGLVGPEYEELFTTLGDLEAKRTTTSPDVAALLVHLLDRAGVDEGDTVAIGASGSFPALLVATLVATEAIGARPVAILSLGASSYGATDPAFDLLHLHRLLVDRGVVHAPPAAASVGGALDVGEDFEPAVRERTAARIRESGVPLVDEPDLARNVARRMEVWFGGATEPGPAGGRSPAAFVNIGGADANIGVSPMVLKLRPGLVEDVPLPPPAQRGALHAMAARGVPVIHLLNVRDLSLRHGLPWDPIPLPEPGTARLTRGEAERSPPLLVIAGIWLASMVILVAVGVMIPSRTRDPDPP